MPEVLPAGTRVRLRIETSRTRTWFGPEPITGVVVGSSPAPPRQGEPYLVVALDHPRTWTAYEGMSGSPRKEITTDQLRVLASDCEPLEEDTP